MYGFTPTEEQQMLIDTVVRYAKNDLRAAGHDAEEAKSLPKKLIGKGWELGILQASVPEAYGGFGERSAVTGVLAAEELAYGNLAGALAVMTPGCLSRLFCWLVRRSRNSSGYRRSLRASGCPIPLR